MTEGHLRDILAELEVRVVHLNRDGWLCCHCPFAEFLHDNGTDKTPDFFVKVDATGISGFHCFACKQHGRISSLVRKLEHYRREEYHGLDLRADMAEAFVTFEEWGARKHEERDPDPLNKAAYLGMYPLAFEHADSRAYLQSRGISQNTSELLSLQFDPDEKRILFPVYDFKHDLYGFTGRTIYSDEQMRDVNERRFARGFHLRYSKVRDYAGLPKEKLLLGEQLIDRDKPLWLVEGLFAFAHMIEIGAREYVNPLAPMGSKLTDYQRDVIAEYGKPVWLCFDNDKAGDEGTFGVTQPDGTRQGGAVEMLRQHVPVFVPYYPDGINDPDKLTIDNVAEMLASDTFPLA